MRHLRIVSTDDSVWFVEYRGTPVAPVIKQTDKKIVFEDVYKSEEVGRNAFVHKLEINLTDDSKIDEARAAYSEMSEDGSYKRYEFAVTASATNIFDGGMIRFGSADCLSFWFHILFLKLDNESESDGIE